MRHTCACILSFINVLKEEHLFAKTGFGPIETVTIHTVAWVIL